MMTDKKTFFSGEDSCERFYSIVSISADYIFEYSLDEKLFTLYKNVSGEFTEIISADSDFEQRIKGSNLVYSDDIDTFAQVCDNVRSGIDRASFEVRFAEFGTDDFNWYRIKMKTVRNDENRELRIIGKLENISDIKNAEKRLVDKAERDPLTKIYNKATTKKLIKNYLRSDTKETYDAFIIIDVDDFKHVNDTLGHLFGDSILVDLSQEMQDLFRSNDVVGRIGGDEFLVFLRGMKHKNHIESKANDICKIFDLLYAREDGKKITGSLGIALFPQDGDTFDELYRKADLALYASKRAGKSCYTFYSAEYEEKASPSAIILPRVEQYRRNLDFLHTDTSFDMTIIKSALDFDDEESYNKVYDLLYKIGKHYNLSRVSVYEYMENESVYKITEQWNGKHSVPTLGESFKTGEHTALVTRADFDDNGIFMADLLKPELNRHEQFLKAYNVKSCISCGYFKKGKLMGFLSFEECVAPRTWSIEEAKAVISASKAVFMHYFKLRDLGGKI